MRCEMCGAAIPSNKTAGGEIISPQRKWCSECVGYYREEKAIIKRHFENYEEGIQKPTKSVS